MQADRDNFDTHDMANIEQPTGAMDEPVEPNTAAETPAQIATTDSAVKASADERRFQMAREAMSAATPRRPHADTREDRVQQYAQENESARAAGRLGNRDDRDGRLQQMADESAGRA